MFLGVGNRQRIDDPTPEQTGRHLRNLPAEAPFVVLNADDEHFIQATPVGAAFRVEWRQEAEQRFMLVSPGEAEAAFSAFCRWDEAALNSFPWKRLAPFSDPYRGLIFVAAALFVIVLVSLWSSLH